MIETLAHGYSSDSIQRELSNEYQHGRVLLVFKNLCVLVLWTKVALALEGLNFIVIGLYLHGYFDLKSLRSVGSTMRTSVWPEPIRVEAVSSMTLWFLLGKPNWTSYPLNTGLSLNIPYLIMKMLYICILFFEKFCLLKCLLKRDVLCLFLYDSRLFSRNQLTKACKTQIKQGTIYLYTKLGGSQY